LERLEIWKDCYNDRAKPFNLSHDKKTKMVNVAGEDVPLSHVLFKPNIFISTHVPRRYENSGDEDLMNMGSIIKNLLGLIPDTKKYRFHKQLPTALLDMYEAVGGIDLAILDGTHTYLGYKEERVTVLLNKLVVGRDAFAVEAVGAYMVGFEPTEMPVLQEAKKRGLGFSPHTWTNGVGLWTNLHTAALGDRKYPLEFPYEPDSWTPKYRDGILKEPILPKDGFLELPQEPGLGIPIDWDKVKKFGRKFFSMTEGDLRKKVMKEKGVITALKLKRRKDKEQKSN